MTKSRELNTTQTHSLMAINLNDVRNLLQIQSVPLNARVRRIYAFNTYLLLALVMRSFDVCITYYYDENKFLSYELFYMYVYVYIHRLSENIITHIPFTVNFT